MRQNIVTGFTDTNLITRPTAKVTIERYLPSWTTLFPPESFSAIYGHSAIIDNGKLIRVRYNNSNVEANVIDLSSPNWSSTYTNIASSTMQKDKGMLDIVKMSSGNYRIFFYSNSTTVKTQECSVSGTSISTVSSTLGTLPNPTDGYLAQLSAIDENTVFVSGNVISNDNITTKLIDERVHTVVYKVTLSNGTWSVVSSKEYYPSYNIEGGYYRDNFVVKKDGTGYTNVLLDDNSATELISRWGYRPNGGLATIHNSDSSNTIIYAGTFWNKYKFNSHAHGVHIFIENDTAWRKLADTGTSDYDESSKLFYDAHVANSGNIVTWVAVTEPGYFNQYYDDISIPRVEETVASILDETGQYLTEPIKIGGLEYAGAKILEDTSGNLYCIGYSAVKSSPPASIFSSTNTDILDISDNIRSFSQQLTARVSSNISVDIALTTAVLNDSRFAPNNIINIYVGNNTQVLSQMMKLGSARIASITPSINLSSHTASIIASFEGIFDNTYISQMQDILPESIINDVVPGKSENPVMKHIGFSNGNWEVAQSPNIWDDNFCNGDYGMATRNTIRLLSAPWAYTGGTNIDKYDIPGTITDSKEVLEGGPGKVLDRFHPQDAGSWANDIIWLASPSSTDGFIKISTRYGFPLHEIKYTNEDGTGSVLVDNNNLKADGVTKIFDDTLTVSNIVSNDNAATIAKSWGILVQRSHKIHPHFNTFLQFKLTTGKDKNIGILESFSHIITGYFTDSSVNTYERKMQWALSSGIIFHAQDIGQKYIFSWEASVPPSSATHIDDVTKVVQNFDEVDYSNVSANENRLAIIVTDNNNLDDNERRTSYIEPPATSPAGTTASGYELVADNTVIASTSSPVTLGRAMDMLVRSVNGVIECYSRPTKTSSGTNATWVHAFTLNSSRFGAGRIGIYGRGGAGVQWDKLWDLREVIAQNANVVDFWNIESSDTSENYTIEEILRALTWKAGVKASFRNIGEATLSVSSTVVLTNPATSIVTPTTNQVVSGEANVNNSTASALIRVVETSSPSSYIKFKFTSTTITKSVFLSGVEDASTIDSYPMPTSVDTSKTFTYKITAIDNKYSVWINNVYVGFFTEDTELGTYTAISASGTNPYIDARIPELYEVPDYTTLDTGQNITAVLKKLIGERRIKAIPKFNDGTILFTYSTTHDDAGVLNSSIIQNDLKISNSVIARATVEGAYAKATYVSDEALKYGNRSANISQPNLMLTEHCYREAQLIVSESIATRVRCSLVGAPRFEIEPEDKVSVNITEQSLANGNNIVDDIAFTYRGGEKPTLVMALSTRKQGVA